MIKNKNSVLPVITLDSDLDSLWEEVKQVAAPHINDNAIKRLRPVLDHRIKTVAVERHYIDKDYRDTFSNYHSKRFATPDSRCIRLHFFDKAFQPDDISKPKCANERYLGYSIMRPTRPNALGRTLLSPDQRILDGAQICTTEECVNLLGCDLTVSGFPFISQDADVTVCAQSALWMILRYFSDRYPVYAESGPYQIGQLTSDYSLGRLYPSPGLTMWQMAEALRLSGLHPLSYSKANYNAEDFGHLLYTYIESGIPCLLGLDDHVIVAYGHRSDFNAKTSAPLKNGFVPSSKFNGAFIVSDDNCFPYQSLERQGGAAHPSKYSFDDIGSFVVPLPEKVFLPAEDAQKVAMQIVDRYRSLSEIFSKNDLVTRTFLTTVRSFKRHITEREMGNEDVKEIYRNLPLPHFIWVTEFGLIDEYPDFVRGEIIWDATRNGHELVGWIALHAPEYLMIDIGSAFNGPQRIDKRDLKNSSKYPLFVSNLCK